MNAAAIIVSSTSSAVPGIDASRSMSRQRPPAASPAGPGPGGSTTIAVQLAVDLNGRRDERDRHACGSMTPPRPAPASIGFT